MRGTPTCPSLLVLVLTLSGGAITTSSAQTAEPPQAGKHMAFTPNRPGTPGDTARALQVVERLRAAIAPYETLERAEAAGYRSRKEPEMVKRARLLHVGKRMGHRGKAKPFDPASPQALLYRRDGDGQFRLAGAMFVAAPSATLDDLDAMIPLSVAHWHQHLNICIAGNRESFRRIPKATTAEACGAAEVGSGRSRATWCT